MTADTHNEPVSPYRDSDKERRGYERFEWAHIVNDAAIALWFLVGSVFFLYPSLELDGTWLFIIGSGQMLVGVMIRTFNKIFYSRFRKELIHW